MQIHDCKILSQTCFKLNVDPSSNFTSAGNSYLNIYFVVFFYFYFDVIMLNLWLIWGYGADHSAMPSKISLPLGHQMTDNAAMEKYLLSPALDIF